MDIVTLVMACSLFQNYSITNAMIQVGSKNNPLMVTPASGNSTIFPNIDQATNYIDQQIQQDNLVNIGVTQISSRWLKTYQITPAEIIKPCKNVATASEIITKMWDKCGHIVSDPSNADQVQACALSMFKTADPQAGLDYANQIMNYATAHPFEKVAAPAMAHWEKNAKIPKLATATLSKSDKKSPLAIKKKPTTTNENAAITDTTDTATN